jgi:hypothetical protein
VYFVELAAGIDDAFRVVLYEAVVHHEKSGIEAAVLVGRCDGSRDKVHVFEWRLDIVCKVFLPNGVPAAQRRGRFATYDETCLFKGFPDSGQR